MEEGRPVVLHGDGSSARDYTFVDDVADGTLRALDRPDGFRILNLGGAHATTLADLVAALERALGRKAVVERLPDQPGDVPTTCADVTRAHEALGWSPRTSLEEGLARFTAWMRGA